MEQLNEIKKQQLLIELNYLQLLCIQEVVNSIEQIYRKQQKGWPEEAEAWQLEIAKRQLIITEAGIVTQLIQTSLADKFVPKGYPIETFQFIKSLKKDTNRFDALLKELVQDRVVSNEKLLFFSTQIQALLNDAKRLTDVFTYEQASILGKFWKRNKTDYFIKALHRFFDDID